MDKKNHVPDWKLQRYLISELPQDELEAIRALSQSDDGLRARIDALAARHAEIRAKYPPEWMARKARLVAQSRSGRAGRTPAEPYAEVSKFPLLRIALPALACAALAISLPVYMSSTKTASGDLDGAGVWEERAKGEWVDAPALQIWRKAGNTPERLAPGAAARAGDVVQLWYAVPTPCYGMVVSVDGRGALTVHLSGSGNSAAELTPGRPVTLPVAYKLDDAPQYEAFYLITSPDRFDPETVKKIIMGAEHPIADARSLPLPRKHIAAFTLRKFSDREI